MGFTIEQECPQCGAPIEFDETDRLLQCPFCEVSSFLFSNDCFRFVLPDKAKDKEIIYAPYLRFKGSSFSCDIHGVRHRIVDITQLGVPFKRFPISLGLRPQAMKMRFAKTDTAGSFLKCFLKTSDLLARAEKHSSGPASEKVFHRAFIGEAVNLIYLPLYVERKTLFDAITNNPIARLPKQGDMFSSLIDSRPRWKLTFLATLCPKCGWSLKGEKDSVVLFCGNCGTAWEPKKGRFVQVDLAVVPGDRKAVYSLPFWKMSVRAEGIQITSYADFIRATRQPKVIRKAWENQEMCFWSPAFKIRPKRFLLLSRRMTMAQEVPTAEERLPGKHLYPVTLPLSEAIQGIKLTLAGSAVNKKKIIPRLPDTGLSIKNASLVYLPFHETVHELIQPHTNVSINRKSLEFGRFL
ncbi:MAG: hypothetical protein JRL30_08375 [Deltaproteobacteria bacterium]|nr:hypothetical protein [Deltaproteobacteria bacterium]